MGKAEFEARLSGKLQGDFVMDAQRAIKSGYARFYLEQLNLVAEHHGQPVYEPPEKWGRCDEPEMLKGWMRRIHKALVAFSHMIDPEGKSGGQLGLGRKFAGSMHRMLAVGMENRLYAIQGGDSIEQGIDAITSRLKPKEAPEPPVEAEAMLGAQRGVDTGEMMKGEQWYEGIDR